MNKKEKKLLKQIIYSIIFLLLALILPINGYLKIVLYLISYYFVGKNVYVKSIKNIKNKEIFDENFLMLIATIGAFSINDFLEGVLVMLLYQIGELFQSYAVNKSRKSISSLMDVRPDYANILENGKLKKISPYKVKIDDVIVVKTGEKIPLDGIVIEGSSYVDKSYLTGESVPVKVTLDDEVLSGCINKEGLLQIRVTKEFKQSTVSKILDLVENASSKKAKSENFITKFARIYTPIVVILALLLALVPPLFTDILFEETFKRALTFLVISCPCALVISVPLSFFCGIGGASKCGILIKGSNYLEEFAKIHTIYFDKTGTLTKGNFEVVKVNAINISEEELIKIAAYAECYSSHPIALSIKNYYKETIDESKVKNPIEIAGTGIHVMVDDKDVYIGNEKLISKFNVKIEKENIGTTVYIVIDDVYCGYILIADEIKDSAKETINYLKKNDIKTIMLTGDNDAIAKNVSTYLGIDKYYAELLPDQKLKIIENEKDIAFVGDGINDAPALISADIGISMGTTGTDAAIEAADIVIMDDDLNKLEKALKISKKTLKIVKQNIAFSIFVKIIFLILGALGISNMMGSVFADVGVSIIAIINAMRTLKMK